MLRTYVLKYRMDYTTRFKGAFQFSRPLDEDTRALLDGLRRTRRMRRDIKVLAESEGLNIAQATERYGADGEFYYDPMNFANFGEKDTLAVGDNFNTPPENQPSLWLKWEVVTSDGRDYLTWDGSEKFTGYVEWLEYIINRILNPRGYHLRGAVYYKGEDPHDRGVLNIQLDIVCNCPITFHEIN